MGIVDKIKSNGKIMEKIDKIKSHEWVKVIEGSKIPNQRINRKMNTQMQSMFNVSRDTSNRYLNRLIKLGVLKGKEGEKPYVMY